MHVGPLEHAIDSVGPVVVAVWNGPLCPRGLATLGGTLRRTRQRFADGIGLMLVWQPPTVVPAAPERTHVAAILTDVGPTLRGVVHVVAGRGFWASAVRSSVADIARLDYEPQRHAVFPETEAGTGWLTQRLGLVPVPANVANVANVA